MVLLGSSVPLLVCWVIWITVTLYGSLQMLLPWSTTSFRPGPLFTGLLPASDQAYWGYSNQVIPSWWGIPLMGSSEFRVLSHPHHWSAWDSQNCTVIWDPFYPVVPSLSPFIDAKPALWSKTKVLITYSTLSFILCWSFLLEISCLLIQIWCLFLGGLEWIQTRTTCNGKMWFT